MLSKTIMMGRLVADPELRHTQSNVPVCSFRIAVDRDFSKNGEKETDFFDVVAWRGTAEFVSKYFAKGRVIAVEGRFQNKSWTDRDGNKRKDDELLADNVYFGDSKRSDDGMGNDGAGQFAGHGEYGGYSAPAPGQFSGGFAPDF